MSAEKTGLAREFQPIEDRAEALRMLKDGARTIASTMIWTSNQDQVIHSHLSLNIERWEWMTWSWFEVQIIVEAMVRAPSFSMRNASARSSIGWNSRARPVFSALMPLAYTI